MRLLKKSLEHASVFHHFSLEKLPASQENAELIRILLKSNAFTLAGLPRGVSESEQVAHLPNLPFVNLLKGWLMPSRHDAQHGPAENDCTLRNGEKVVELYISLASLYAAMTSKTGIPNLVKIAGKITSPKPIEEVHTADLERLLRRELASLYSTVAGLLDGELVASLEYQTGGVSFHFHGNYCFELLHSIINGRHRFRRLARARYGAGRFSHNTDSISTGR